MGRLLRPLINLDKLKDPNISSLFEARIGGKFGPLLLLEGDAEAITNNFNEVMTEAIMGHRRHPEHVRHTQTTEAPEENTKRENRVQKSEQTDKERNEGEQAEMDR